MRISVARVMRAASLFASAKNRILNSLARVLTGHVVAINWRNVKVIHPERISIGDRFSCGQGVWLESVDGNGNLIIGREVNFSDYVHVGCVFRVEIGDGTLVGSKVLITDHSHGQTGEGLSKEQNTIPNMRRIVCRGPVHIGRRVWIGDGACVLSGVTIGDGAIVGANAVVTDSIPSGTIWGGVPARQIWPKRNSDSAINELKSE